MNARWHDYSGDYNRPPEKCRGPASVLLLEKGAKRFNEIEKALDLNPTQVNRALAFLRKGLWVVPKTLPVESGPIRVEYRLCKRGAAFLASFESFRLQAKRREATLSKAAIAELQSLSL